METKWYCFLFWFSYRLTLACLAHFNWCMSIYTNCAYFTLWKSYDLLWFWSHFLLCSCFPQLRRENYLIVWSNLVLKKCTKYPDYSFKQLYYALYTTTRSTHFTKRLMSRKEKRGVIDIETNSDEENEPTNSRSNKINEKPIKVVEEQPIIEESDEEEEAIGETNESTPLRPPRPSRATFATSSSDKNDEPENDEEDQVLEIVKEEDTGDGKKWKFMPMKFLQRQSSSTPSIQSESPSTFSKIYERFRPNRNNSNPSVQQKDEIEILRPDYSNRYDIHNKSKREAREKRDRKALRARIRRELRIQMQADAANERQRKKITDAIELLLQLLRMMSSFAMLIGTIRKTFIPAQFKYLKPGQHAYDNYELIILFRCTAFFEIAMFWMNVSYAYCLQWQLCCRLGCMRFLFWSTILGLVSVGMMMVPMTYVMNDLDLSWCRFVPDSPFAKYQPGW